MSYLEVTDLRVEFGGSRQPALRGISFAVDERERLGIIGQSGSGKSVTALAIMGLLPAHARITGSIKLDGRELVGLPERELQKLRGDEISMIFQEPMTALDPTMKVGRQVGEVVALHHGERRGAIHDEVLTWLGRVGITEPDRIADSYPHELSGGQRQRALIAMALANQPGLVLCDEPTTALDVLVQRQILLLLAEQLADRAAVFVSHDLAVVRQVCQRVAVMLQGEIVEQGTIDEVIAQPRHPYTQGLIASARIDRVQPGQPLPSVEDYYPGVTS
ncbi:ABC transporter ATP-binding protein [Tessaracoccus sp. MC1679]|uniref:ABC transporter ATP-binding protein n=1 Tax=Tessaracoccus sp. MC1679 TaxID=2760313 RepID=UPI00160376C9|nr:ABC transporter ATP-binding protein [Tessaracoccus sp. MC1679]MBB1516188.1 ABC transporter ATP-binding protein [Tessaracoccus sp. MC1679]